MPRQARIRVAGGAYHVYTRGNRRQLIFADEDDYRFFLVLLTRTVRRFGWRVHAYCLMPNHLHLLVQTPEQNLSEGMHWLLGFYAQSFNHRHGLDGHVFQGRFGSRIVETEAYLTGLIEYIVFNPVRAGLVLDPADWPWSSYRAMVAGNAQTAVGSLSALLDAFRDATRGRVDPGHDVTHRPRPP
jgi:putative transposase